MEYEIYKSEELYHHGIVGMKWGVRRYQRKDGSLTPAGEKRRARIEADLKSRERILKNKERTQAKIDKLSAKKAELDAREDALTNKKKPAEQKPEKPVSSTKKSVKDMTDDELKAMTDRMRAEKEYYEAAKNLAQAKPVQVSKGKKFMNSLMNEVIAPAAKAAGKDWLEKTLKNKLGLNEKDPIKRLEDEAKKFKSMKEIEEYKDTIRKIQNGGNRSDYPEVKTWDDMTKKQAWEKEEEKRRRERGDN